MASSLSGLSSPDPRLPPQLPPSFLAVPGAPVCPAAAELWPNWNLWEKNEVMGGVAGRACRPEGLFLEPIPLG